MKKKLLPALMIAALAGAALAEDGWIKQPATLRGDQSPAGEKLSDLVKGDKVIVLERSGTWMKVNLNGKVGWVAANSVAPREQKRDSKLAGGSSTVEGGTAAAGKGLEQLAKEYADTHNLNRAGLDEMVAFSKTINSKMLSDFVKEGNVRAPAASK